MFGLVCLVGGVDRMGSETVSLRTHSDLTQKVTSKHGSCY